MALLSIATSLFTTLKFFGLCWIAYTAFFYAVQFSARALDPLVDRLRTVKLRGFQSNENLASLKRDLSHVYPKAHGLIESIRAWLSQSYQAQKCYHQVVQTFMHNATEEFHLSPEDIDAPTMEDVRDFFHNRWPTFLASPKLENEGTQPREANQIYLTASLLDAYENDQSREEQWRHLLLTIILHELAISMTKSLLPSVGGLVDDHHGYTASGWHLEDVMFGGSLEVEWPASREGHLDQIVRFVLSSPSATGGRISHDLSHELSGKEDERSSGAILSLWTKEIQTAIVGNTKGDTFPTLQDFLDCSPPQLPVVPPEGCSRNRATLTAMPKPPERAPWTKKLDFLPAKRSQ